MTASFAVHALDGGTIDVARKNIFHIGGPPSLTEGPDITIPVPSYLIRHPKGNVLFDGGNQLEVARDAQSYWGLAPGGPVPNMSEDQHVLAQVLALDVDPESVLYVVHSHLHHDHAGATGHFPRACELVHEDELRYAFAPDWFARFVYNRADYDRPGVNWKTFALSEAEPELDLYADGTIRLIYTPGHSVGHVSMIVALEGQPLILAGDAVDDRPHYEGVVLPGWYVDARQVVRSVARIKCHEAALGARVLFGHSYEQWQTVPKGREAFV